MAKTPTDEIRYDKDEVFRKEDALRKREALSTSLGKIADLENDYAKRSAERTAAAEAINRGAAGIGDPIASTARSKLGGGGQGGGFSNPILASPNAKAPVLGDIKSPGFRSESDGFQTTQQNTFAPGQGRQAFDSIRGRIGTDVAMWKDKTGQDRVMSITNTPKYAGEEGLNASQMRGVRPGLDQQAADFTTAQRSEQAKQGIELAKSQSKILGDLYTSMEKYSTMAAGFNMNPVTGQAERIEDPKMIEHARGMVEMFKKQIDSINAGIYQAGNQGQSQGQGQGQPGADPDGDLIRQVQGGGPTAAGQAGGAPQKADPDADLKSRVAKAGETLSAAKTATPGPFTPMPGGQQLTPEQMEQYRLSNIIGRTAMGAFDTLGEGVFHQNIPGGNTVPPAAPFSDRTAMTDAQPPASLAHLRGMTPAAHAPSDQGAPVPFDPSAPPADLSKWIHQKITAERPAPPAPTPAARRFPESQWKASTPAPAREIRMPVTAERPAPPAPAREIRLPVTAERPAPPREIRRPVTATRPTQQEQPEKWITRPVTAEREEPREIRLPVTAPRPAPPREIRKPVTAVRSKQQEQEPRWIRKPVQQPEPKEIRRKVTAQRPEQEEQEPNWITKRLEDEQERDAVKTRMKIARKRMNDKFRTKRD